MRALRPLAVLILVGAPLLLAACDDRVREPRSLEYDLVDSFPHDTAASTQGLLLHDGYYYESTGGYGTSSLRRVDPETGEVRQKNTLPSQVFGEGLTLRDGRLYQLEWKGGKGFIYDVETFAQVGTFYYEGEGWGLAWNGEHLILSDGTPVLRFLDPDSFEVVRRVIVQNHRGPISEINELEWIDGRIFANRWHTDDILIIDPKTGVVEATLYLGGLERPRPRDQDASLNGIAFDPETGLLHVTGKKWPRVHLLRIRE